MLFIDCRYIKLAVYLHNFVFLLPRNDYLWLETAGKLTDFCCNSMECPLSQNDENYEDLRAPSDSLSCSERGVLADHYR